MLHRLRDVTVVFLVIAIGLGEAAQAQCQANESAKLTASNAGADDEFGFAVSMDGDVAVIGAYHHDVVGANVGSAYIYRFNGTSWTEETQLTASDGEPGDLFGYSTFVDGDVILIGAYQDDHLAPDAGAAYVFRYDTDASEWIEEAKLISPEPDTNDQFGWKVVLSGDIAMVSSVHEADGLVFNAGAVYVYRFDPDTVEWIYQARLTASDGVVGDHLGWSMSLSGGVLVIGTPLHNGAGGEDSGAAYVFIEPVDGWVDMTETARLIATGSTQFHRYGVSVSICGDVVMVGAHGDSEVARHAGAAFVFEKPKGGWVDMTETAKLTASDGQMDDNFGWSVAVSGDVAVITARRDDSVTDQIDTGSAYVFRLDPDSLQWTAQVKLTASDAAEEDRFGWAVSISNDTAVIGAVWDDDGGTNAGSAYIFGLGDCNDNGEFDLCDIADGESTDLNNNGIPDECEDDCPWDLDDGGDVGINDFLDLLAQWGTDPGGPPDFDGDGTVGITDFLTLLANWGPC